MDYFQTLVGSFGSYTKLIIIKRVKDRDYRVAVNRQHRRVLPVVEWYDTKLEVGPFSPCSEKFDSKNYREFSSGINSTQKILRRSFSGSAAAKGSLKYSESLNGSPLSLAGNSQLIYRRRAPPLYILPRPLRLHGSLLHDTTKWGKKRSHLLLRKFEYHNFFDGRVVKPLFGVGREQTLMLANQILDMIERPVYVSCIIL